MAVWQEPPEEAQGEAPEEHDYDQNCWCPSCGSVRGANEGAVEGSRGMVDTTSLDDAVRSFQAFSEAMVGHDIDEVMNPSYARAESGREWSNWGWSVSEREEPRREMIPATAVLEIPAEEAERQQALYAEVPNLTPREKNLMAIYDAVIAGEKIIRLDTVLEKAGAFKYERFPKVALAPVTAERVTFRRFTKGTRLTPGRLNAYFQAGQWRYDLLKEQGWEPFWNRVSHAESEAMTPLVPPPDRDKVQEGDLFLWEATWLSKKETVINYDPAVIRPLSNGLYRVVLAWDLTEAEAMILGGE